MQGEHLKYLRALQALADHPGTDAVAKHVTTRQQELSEKRKIDGDHAKFETTRVIREAALDTFQVQALR